MAQVWVQSKSTSRCTTPRKDSVWRKSCLSLSLEDLPMSDRTSVKGILAGTALGLSLLCPPMLYAQAAGGGAPGNAGATAGDNTRGTSGQPGNSSNVTSPSTLGGSVSGSSSDPAVPGATAGDTSVKNSTPPPATAPDYRGNEAVQQRKAQSPKNE
jgi:hypothetical protein